MCGVYRLNHCIYLKKSEPEVTFSSEEHIFPAGIGGMQKLPLSYVSHNCNNDFSKMELFFMRNSLIALPRQFYGPGKRGKLNNKNATKSSVTLMNAVNDPVVVEFGYISLGKPYVITQMKFNSDGSCRFVSDRSFGDPNKQFKDFIKSFEKFEEKYELFINEKLSQSELIIGYFEKKWYVALSNPNLETNIISYIEKILEYKILDNPNASFGTMQPNVKQTFQFDNRYYRVCAKIIFNYLAFVKGQDFVLEKSFDPIRDWIVRGGENKFAGLMVDKSSYPIAFPEKSHRLFIVKSNNSLKGLISFYGGEFVTQIILCEGFKGDFEIEGYVCDWENRKEFSFVDYVNRYY